MNLLLESLIFIIFVYAVIGISTVKKGKLGMIQEYPKAIQDRCRELGLIEEDAYHDYWYHIKYAVIGMFTQAVIALPVGLFVMFLARM